MTAKPIFPAVWDEKGLCPNRPIQEPSAVPRPRPVMTNSAGIPSLDVWAGVEWSAEYLGILRADPTGVESELCFLAAMLSRTNGL